jgi:hypothetical protein
MGSKDIKPYVHEGEVLTPVKVLGVTLYADPQTVKDYNESLDRVHQAFRRSGDSRRFHGSYP